MEASGFEQGIDGADEDPFAGSDFGDFEPQQDETTLVEQSAAPAAAPAPAAAAPERAKAPQTMGDPEDEAPAAEIPTVNAEGEPVVAGTTEDRFVPPPVEAVPPPVAPAKAAPAAAPPAVETQEEAEQRRAAMVAAQAPEPPEEVVSAAPPAAEPAPAADPPPVPTDGAPTAPSVEAEPPAKAAKKGKAKAAAAGTAERKYLVLRQIGEEAFELVSWYEAGGKMVAKGAEGAKKQTVALARDNDSALAIGYAALGSPPDGVKLVAVAESLFQIKPVRPKAVVPTKVTLQIG